MSETYTREQVASHNQRESGWFIINNDVYDVSHYYGDHPGGRDILLDHIGKDATDDFDAQNHSLGAQKKLRELKVGTLVEAERRKFITLKDLADKKTAKEIWFSINNKVYDVTGFLDMHPGGRDILLHNGGGDATAAFTDNGHSDRAYKMLEKFFIGFLDPADRRKPLARKTAAGEMPAAAGRRHAEDESLLGRIQEQLKLFIFLAIFVMAGFLLLS